MSDSVKAAFDRRLMVLPVEAVEAARVPPPSIRQSAKYRRIAQSISEIGVIEPLVVARPRRGEDRHLLLDGNLRFAILLERGETSVRCLLADDDEAFTYNKRINRLATIQEHYMIVRALKRGVPEEKLARALNVDVRAIKRRRIMLDGVCPEVIDLLKDRNISTHTIEVLRKMKPMRQIEAVELMIALNNFTCAYAKALLAATRQADLAQPEKPKKVGNMTPEQMARLEREMNTLNQDFRALEASYGDDVLQLVISAGYVGRLIANASVEQYLAKRHPELLEELRGVVAAASLDQAGGPAKPVDDDGVQGVWPVDPTRIALNGYRHSPQPDGAGLSAP